MEKQKKQGKTKNKRISFLFANQTSFILNPFEWKKF